MKLINNINYKFMIYISVFLVVLLALSGCKAPEGEKEDESTKATTKRDENVDDHKIEVKNIYYDISFDEEIVLDNKEHEIYHKEVPIKGIYVTAPTAGSSRLEEMINIADTTEVNAFVIDVKSDDGRITYDMNVPLADEIGAEYKYIRDIDALMDKLYDHDIYPIARIVVFKDPFLSKKVTDFAVKNKDGSLFVHNGVTWLNPYNHDIWKYMVDICKEVAGVGFKEIQFDYIRFGERYRVNSVLPEQIDPEKTKEDIILDYLAYVKEELSDYDIKISADVFGTVITSKIDADIVGQNYVEMSRIVDIICPMVYPSHYGRGYYGIPYDELPDSYPYNIIYGSMSDSNEELSVLPKEDQPITRPWLQAFSWHGVSYGGYEIRQQIDAAYDAGLSEWILWNAGNYYNRDGLLPSESLSEEVQ